MDLGNNNMDIAFDEDEEFRLAIAMSLSENNNNNDGGDNNNGSGDNNNNDEKKEEEEKKEEKKEEEEEKDENAENHKFVRQFTVNCLCCRSTTGTYDSDHILDEDISGDSKSSDGKAKTVTRGLLDTSSEADDSKKKLTEDKDAKLISALPLFTRLAVQNLNEIASKGNPNLSDSADFTLFVLKAYRSAVRSSVYLVTRNFCTLSNTQRINAFLAETAALFFEVMEKYAVVLEINSIRDVLLDIVVALLVENKSVTSPCNVLDAEDANALKTLVKNPKTTVLDGALAKENGEIKDSILRLLSEDNNNNNNNNEDSSVGTKDFFTTNIESFVGRNGLEIILDYVISKFVQNAKENTNTASSSSSSSSSDGSEVEEMKEKKAKTDEAEADNAQEDLFNSVLSFMKFFSHVYSGFITKCSIESDDQKARMKAINAKLFSVFSAVVLGSIRPEGRVPPFPLFLVVFKTFSDTLTYARKAGTDSFKNLKALFAHRVITAFSSAPKGAKWAEHPLSKNALNVLAYAVEALAGVTAGYNKSCAASAEAAAQVREKIASACSSAAKGEFGHLEEVLEQDHCAVLSTIVCGGDDDGQSIVDTLVSASANLSREFEFTGNASDAKESASSPKKSGSKSLSSSLKGDSFAKDVSDSYLLGSLFQVDSSQDSVAAASSAGEQDSCCTDKEDNICKTCARIYRMCKQLIAATPALRALDPLVTFAQNISPNDNSIHSESGAFAKNIRSKKNYLQLTASFREFARALLEVDSKGKNGIGEALARKVFERFPLFGPLECVLMTAKFWALNRLRPSAQQQQQQVALPIASEVALKFIATLAETAKTGTGSECLELVNYERAEEILFLFNCCLDREARAKVAVAALTSLAAAAEGAASGSISCPEALTALVRLTEFAMYFVTFFEKAPAAFVRSVTENVLERSTAGTPAEEAYPCKVITDASIIFERSKRHLELQPYYLFMGSPEAMPFAEEAAIAECIKEKMPSLMNLVSCAYEGCDARLRRYSNMVVYSFFVNAFTTRPGDVWADALASSSSVDAKVRGTILLLLIATFVDTESPELLRKFIAQALNTLAEGGAPAEATFGLLLFVLSAIDADRPAAKGADAPREDAPASLFDKLAAVEGHKASTADELVARMDAPTGLVGLAAKAGFEWDRTAEAAVTVAKRLLDEYIARIGGEDAEKLRAFVYSGLSLSDEVVKTVVPKLETYKAKFTSVATLKGLLGEAEAAEEEKKGNDSAPSAKDTFICSLLSVAVESDAELVLKMNLNLAALLAMRTLLAADLAGNSSAQTLARKCLALDNFKFADYGVFYDALISADRTYAGTIADGLWSQFLAAQLSSSTLVSDERMLDKLLALQKTYPNKKALYRLLVVHNGNSTPKIVEALRKDGAKTEEEKEKESSEAKHALAEAIRESGLSVEDDAVAQGIVQKLLAVKSAPAISLLYDLLRRSGAEGEDAALGDRLYASMLNLADNGDAIAKISPKTYFVAIQMISFKCGRLTELFRYAMKKLRGAAAGMKVEEEEEEKKKKESAGGSSGSDLAYPYALIVGSFVRMLTLSQDGADRCALMDPCEAKVERALEKMAKSLPYWGCPEKDPSLACTFLKTGKNFVKQTWYYCTTCGLVNNTGCCTACAVKCHKGHKLALGRTSSAFYCDCGAGASPTGNKCISCARPAEESGAMDVEKEEAAAAAQPSAGGNGRRASGLYDASKLRAEDVAELRAEVLSQDTFSTLLEYLSSNSSTLVGEINREASGSAGEGTSASAGAAIAEALIKQKQEADAFATVAKPTAASCQESRQVDFTEDIKRGELSFRPFRPSSMGFERMAPNVLNYAHCVAQLGSDKLAVVSGDTLCVLSAKDVARRAPQSTLLRVELPIAPVGIAFHPDVPGLLAAFNSEECHVVLFTTGSCEKEKHRVKVTLFPSQDDGYSVLDAFWIPGPSVLGPFLCVVTQKSVLVYDVTLSTEEPVWSREGGAVAGAVCMKSEVMAAPGAKASVRATLVVLKNAGGRAMLTAFRLSNLGAGDVECKSADIHTEGIMGEQTAIYYVRPLNLLLLTSFRSTSVTGYRITVNNSGDGSGNFSVTAGEKLRIFSSTLLCITDTVVGDVSVIAGISRDRSSVVMVVLGSESLQYFNARIGSFVSGFTFIDRTAEGERDKYLFIAQATSRVSVSTISRMKVFSSSALHLSRLEAENARKQRQPKEKAKEAGAEDAEAKKANAAAAASSMATYAFLPQSAPEISENSVYAMIRGGPSSYAIEGDLTGEMSPVVARDKLTEPDGRDYSKSGVVSLRRGEFKLRIVNKDSTRVITGLQIGLAHKNKANVPEYVSVFGRRIAVPKESDLCITVAFTFQEVLCAQKYVTIRFGPAKGGLEKIFVDFVTPFFTSRKDFGLLPAEWPQKKDVLAASCAAEARYSTSATAAAGAVISSLRAMDALALSAEAKGEQAFVDTVMRVFTAVPGGVAEEFRLLDMIEGRIKKAPSFVASVVGLLLPIIDASKSAASEDSRAAQLCTIAGFLEKVLASEPDAAFDPVVRGGAVLKLCDAAMTIKSASAARKGGLVASLVSLIFAAQVAVLSRSLPDGAAQCSALVGAVVALLTAANPAIRNECAAAVCAHFARLSDGYSAAVVPSTPLDPAKGFAACLREASARYNDDAELLIAAAKRMSLAAATAAAAGGPGKLPAGSVVRTTLSLAPNTVDFCAWELQSILAALPAVGGHAGATWTGHLVPALYTVLRLAVVTIRAAALCRPRKYVEELCRAVVQGLLPAKSAAEFLNKGLMQNLPALDSCYAVLRVATVATIIRECARESSEARDAVKWLVESLPGDFPSALYEFMDGVFAAEYARLSKVKSSEAKAPASSGGGEEEEKGQKEKAQSSIPAEYFGARPKAASSEEAPLPKESWKPLLADVFVDAHKGPSYLVSFLYAKRLYVAALYLARKIAQHAGAPFDEERWAELIGRNLVQGSLRFAYPSLLRLARSILSSDAALFSRVDKVGQTNLGVLLADLDERTEHFARAPGAEAQGALLELLYGQLAVTFQRAWSWRAHGLGHPKTVPLLYRLVVKYAQNRRVRKDIVTISLALLGELNSSENEGVLNEAAAKLLRDGSSFADELGDFIDLFVVCGNPRYGQQNGIAKNDAVSFLRVLARTKLLTKTVSSVVLSFLDDVVEMTPTPAASHYMYVLADVLSAAENDKCDELCLLDAFDKHTKKLATYPEASLAVKIGGSPCACAVCSGNSAEAAMYYPAATLCTNDMIQVLPTSFTLMFNTRRDSAQSSSSPSSSSSSSSSHASVAPPLFVENIYLKIPQSLAWHVKGFSISVAYRPPASSSQNQAAGEQPKWAALYNAKTLDTEEITLTCGLHIAGIKIESASLFDGQGRSVAKCSSCGAALGSLMCKKCKELAAGVLVYVKATKIVPVRDRLDSEESLEKVSKEMVKALSGATSYVFSPK